MYKILVLNFGGTSSKVALYFDRECIADQTFRHSPEEMAAAPTGKEQLEWRKKLVVDWLESLGGTISDLNAIAGRGAEVREATRSGVYLMDEAYGNALMEHFHPDEPLMHGIRLVAPMAMEFAKEKNIPVYITDPTSVDELQPVARISGWPEYPRRAGFQALNHKAVARKYAESHGKKYEDCRIIVAHMGAGISVGAHCGGRVIDVNSCAYGYGPFSLERAGTVSAKDMMELCFSGKYTKDEVYKKIRNCGGLEAHLHTKDGREVEKRIQTGDQYAALVYEAMGYQIAKEIAACYAAMHCDIEAIVFTGGLCHSGMLMDHIEKYVGRLAPFVKYPGEFENEALAYGAYRVLSGEEEPVLYNINSKDH